MKKIILVIFLFVSLFVLAGCTSNSTTSSDESSTPMNQETLLDSLSEAIKDIFD